MGFSPLGIVYVVGGTFLILLSAIMAFYFIEVKYGKHQTPLLSLFMPVLFNMFGLPFIFAYVLHNGFFIQLYLSEVLFVFVGQFLTCVVLGSFVYIQINNQLRYYLT